MTDKDLLATILTKPYLIIQGFEKSANVLSRFVHQGPSLTRKTADAMCEHPCHHFPQAMEQLTHMCSCAEMNSTAKSGSRYASHAVSFPKYETRSGGPSVAFNDPYAIMAGVGLALMVISLIGIGGICCTKGKLGGQLLFAYFALQVFISAALLWGAIFCFMYRKQAEGLVYDYYLYMGLDMDSDQGNALVKELHRVITAGGALCLVGTFFSVIACWAASDVMGHALTMSRLILACSYVGLASSFALFVFALAVSISGFIGAGNRPTLSREIQIFGSEAIQSETDGKACNCRRRSRTSGVHSIRTRWHVPVGHLRSKKALAENAGSAHGFGWRLVDRKYVDDHWDAISPQLHLVTLEEAKRMARDNMNKLGAACMLFLVLLALNTLAGCAACIELSREKRYGSLNGGDVEMAAANSEEAPLTQSTEESFKITDDSSDIEVMRTNGSTAPAKSKSGGLASTLKDGKSELKYIVSKVKKDVKKQVDLAKSNED
eukprot:scaffold7243_cov394-Prasinococcus_capsulatus_cf.AAC.2